MQPSPPFICRHPLVFTDEETEPQRGKGTCPRPASPPTPPPQLASEYSFLPSSDVGDFVFLVPLILFVALMAPQPQGPHGAVERLDEAMGDPGSGQLLCDAGQGATPSGSRCCWPNKGGHTRIQATFQAQGGSSPS